MFVLQIEAVSLAYDDKAVLSNIDLKVLPGEILGIVGPNGCGKSTLIKGISGTITPRQGRILIKDKDVGNTSRSELARLVSVVPQNPNLPEVFTAFEIVLMGRTPHIGLLRYEGRRDIAIAWEAMEMTQTCALAQRRVGELSGGERQKLVIARALAQEPKLLLLDEPTAHLDINHQVEILDLVKEFCSEEGLAVVAALHDLNLAAQYCDRLAILSEGRVYAEGPPCAVVTPEIIREVYGAEVCVYPHPINGLPTTVVLPKDGRGSLERKRSGVAR